MDSLPTEIFNPLKLDSFVGKSHVVLDFLSDYYKDVESYPVQSQVMPGYLKKGCPDYAPDSPEPLESILEDVRKNIIPGLSFPTEIFNPLELDRFVVKSHAVLDFLSDYYKDVESYPVQRKLIPGYQKKGCPDYAPDSPKPLESILDDVRKNIISGITHW
ncbi:hypothetical protein GIB67_022214 [Kingdonia uniflora]|uniref:Uncharacterized protein n=1 Tax=Kingdonia uniflora TaxID=39325 RepID=A0A7J7M6X1_9MAGN|nr:hypothetical protein GIB67_022214 [Kingdonia uniflora]